MPRLLSLVAAACLACAGIVQGAWAADGPAYGPRLEGFDYPWPVQVFDFTSQKQAMQMAYLDVAPSGTPNGRVAVLLHGKNFCAATWEDTITALSAAGWRVIAPDQLGFCKSTKPAGNPPAFSEQQKWSYAAIASFIAGVMPPSAMLGRSWL